MNYIHTDVNNRINGSCILVQAKDFTFLLEWCQALIPGRYASFTDILFDAGGVVAGLWCFELTESPALHTMTATMKHGGYLNMASLTLRNVDDSTGYQCAA